MPKREPKQSEARRASRFEDRDGESKRGVSREQRPDRLLLADRPDNLPQLLNRTLDHVRPWIAAIDADEVFKFLFRRKNLAGGDADARSHRVAIYG